MIDLYFHSLLRYYCLKLFYAFLQSLLKFMSRMLAFKQGFKILRVIISSNTIKMMHCVSFRQTQAMCLFPIYNMLRSIWLTTFRLPPCPSMRRFAGNIYITINDYPTTLPSWTVRTFEHISTITFKALSRRLPLTLHRHGFPTSLTMMQAKYLYIPLPFLLAMMLRVALSAISGIKMSFCNIPSAILTKSIHGRYYNTIETQSQVKLRRMHFCLR